MSIKCFEHSVIDCTRCLAASLGSAMAEAGRNMTSTAERTARTTVVPYYMQPLKRLSYRQMAERYEEMLVALTLILDNVDFEAGNCSPTDMVAAVLPHELLLKAREVRQRIALDAVERS